MNSSVRPISVSMRSKTRKSGVCFKEVASSLRPFTLPESFKGKATSADEEIISRRRLVQGLLGGFLAVLTPGCSFDFTHQNFKVEDYPQLTSEPERDEIPLEDAQIMTLLKEIIQIEFGFCPDLSQFFDLSFEGQNIHATALIDVIKDQWEAQRILQRAGFTNGYMSDSEEWITLECDKNDRHLFIAINSNEIQIKVDEKNNKDSKNNSVFVKIRPSGDNEKTKPTAMAIDVVRNKTYHNQSTHVVKSRKIIAGDGSVAFFNPGSGYFKFQQTNDIKPFNVNNTATFLKFLENCQCTEMIKQILGTKNPFYDTSINQAPFFPDIDSNDTVRKMLELIPKKDLNLWSRFLNLAFHYKKKDQERKDEYRDPKTTIRSGWGDCDDYAVINAFWSYLHGYYPSYLELNLPKDKDGNRRAHVFVWYESDEYENEKKEQEKRIVILDNDSSTILEPGQTVYDYINKAWPGGQERLEKEA